MQDMTPTGMAMVRRCLCVKDLVNSLVGAVLFTACGNLDAYIPGSTRVHRLWES